MHTLKNCVIGGRSNMLLKSILILYCCVQLNNAVRYDRYTGQKVSPKELEEHRAKHTLAACTIDVEPCDPTERRRLDGSCNNLNLPAGGTVTVPHPRVLPPVYHNGTEERKAKSGNDLPLPRKIRTSLLCEGISVNDILTTAVPGFGIFVFGDIGTVHDIKVYMDRADCCGSTKLADDFLCRPNIIPEDDPVHRFSNIRCMNLTRPLDFQYYGCTNDTTPAPIEEATSAYDLSAIYIIEDNQGVPVRTNEGGQLLVEVENGIIWPPSGKGYCPAASTGEKCFENYSNALLPVQMFAVWFVRHHNYIAKNLAKVNPTWDDDTLYYVAREINIAFSQQIHIYEWLATLVGRDTLVKSGLASEDDGLRDIYDEKSPPEVSLEFVIVYRWFHLLQSGIAKMFKPDGTFIKEHRVVNSTFNAGFLGEDKNIVYLTQGAFRQPAAKANQGIHPDLAELGLPRVQIASDIITNDLHKNRLFGLGPYITYLQHFNPEIKITCFEDLKGIIQSEKLSILQDLYEDVEDIDLLAGLWSENLKGGHISPTLSHFLIESIQRTVRGDRHWYENKSRPHAFTYEKIKEIRKASLATLLCAVGDEVTVIQRHAFLQISPENPLVSCDEIPQIDFTKWAENTKKCDLKNRSKVNV